MLYNLEGNGTDALKSLCKSNIERLYFDQFDLSGGFYKYDGFGSLRILHIISPPKIEKFQLPPQLTDLQIRISPTTRVKFNSRYSGKDALTFPTNCSSLENFEFTCDPDCQDLKIYFELVAPTHLKKLIWKARPHQGSLVLVNFPSELEYISAYEDSNIEIWDCVDRFLPIHYFQEKYSQNIKFNIEK